jgi:large subunit ribosomal protein L29
MKASEIRELTAEEMRSKVVDLKQEHFNLRFQLAVGQLENRSRIADQA